MIKNIILLTYDRLGVGGIETLIIRMSNWLVENDYSVIFITKKNHKFSKLLNNKVRVIELGKYYNYSHIITSKKLKNIDFNKVLLAMSFNPKSNWVLSNIMYSFKIHCVHLMGIYHPRAYTRKGLHLSEKTIGVKLLQYNIANTLFVNNECLTLHQNQLNINFKESIVWPLALNTEKSVMTTKTNTSNTEVFTIISVGRLASFKTYNLYMIKIIKQLLEKGYNVRYNIYGDGDLYSTVTKEIQKLNLTQYIKIHKFLDYKKLKKTISQHHLFIGMGTAAIEASCCNIPVIVAIENNTNAKTYGYINELPDYNIGEMNELLVEKDVIDIIEHTINLTPEKYQLLCSNIFKYVQKYSINTLMPIWLQYAKHNCSYIKIPLYDKIKYFLLELLHPILKKIYK